MFEDARKLAPKLGLANAKDTKAFDYTNRNVRELEPHRARIEAIDDDITAFAGREHLKYIMNCDDGDSLDDKRSKLKFTNVFDLAIAMSSALN